MRVTILACVFAIACGSGSNNNNNNDSGGDNNKDLSMAAQVALSGTVSDTTGNAVPLSGATVEVVGASPANSTTSASDGSFTLMVAAGATVFLRATASNYYPNQVGVVVGQNGSSGVAINVVPTAEVNQVAASLSPPLTLDAAKGIVSINFHNTNKAGGFGATLSASHGNSFTITGNAATYSDKTVANGDNVVIFPNVDTGTTTVSVSTPAGRSCTASQAITNWRVDAGTMTNIDYDCM